ncbi:hypothetical protein L1049_016333 [Liquidambar formosana]|uniref:Alpha-glucan water dikinase phosphohistidine-like domain-containing protein n=1 Tax=Liquidambar formosana TaxID=63359 RepID=A0AAP0X7G8_LIQFO
MERNQGTILHGSQVLGFGLIPTSMEIGPPVYEHRFKWMLVESRGCNGDSGMASTLRLQIVHVVSAVVHAYQYLDENNALILKILKNQNSGELSECAVNQAKLQQNLMYLAAIADCQPQLPSMHAQPTILVAKSVKGEEEIPDGTVAVLTPDMPDVLSHVSVRARNSKHTKVRGAYCLGIFPYGKDSTTLLGGIVVHNTLVTYDRESDKIRFWKTNCSELWKGLYIPGAPAPAPVVSFSRNSTIEMSPTPAPSGLPQNVFPAMPIVLLEVHLLNFTSKENVSLVRWAIFPAESADYISNTTAMSIILRLTEHHMQLPGSFGNYQLVEWNVHPQMKKTWWEQHFWQ